MQFFTYRKTLPVLMLAGILTFSGCGGGSAGSVSIPPPTPTATAALPAERPVAEPTPAPVPLDAVKTEQRFFGSYEYPAAWSHMKVDDPAFWPYKGKKADGSKVSSYVGVRHLETEYAADTAEEYIDARLKELEELNLDGLKTERFTTKQSYPALAASYNEVREDGAPRKVTDIFLPGDFEYVRILAMDYDEGIEPDIALSARALADSFTWDAPKPDDSANWKRVDTDLGSFEIPVTWAETDAYQNKGMGRHFLPVGADPEQPTSNVSILRLNTPVKYGEYNEFIGQTIKDIKAAMGVKEVEFAYVDIDKPLVPAMTFAIPSPPEFKAEQTIYYLLLENETLQLSTIDIGDGVEPPLAEIARRIIETYQSAK